MHRITDRFNILVTVSKQNEKKREETKKLYAQYTIQNAISIVSQSCRKRLLFQTKAI